MSTATTPLSEARIAAYLRGELSEAERAAVEAAMDADPQWLGVLALLAAEQDVDTRGASAPDSSTVDRVQKQFSSRLHPGQRVGRFEVAHPLGRGGMGSVYAAFDPKLERMVALKILHASRPSEQPRLVSEARALAQVNHPNVITVHDVGRWEERVFVAMELIEGQTLRQWRRDARRSWRDVAEVYGDAAKGLAAAHDAGIVHRDVKPSNVMVTEQGRVVVVDFGLAIDVEPPVETAGVELSAGAQTPGTSRAGTPAYMAPEQRRGERATAASDQFALCIALHEALSGALPEASAEPLRDAGFEACRKLPRRVSKVVSRGFELRPEARHSSMQAFAEALREAGNTPLWPLGVGTLSALTAFLVWPSGTEEKTCSGAEDELAAVWTPERRDKVEASLRAPGGVWSESVADTVLPRLDEYAQQWLVEHATACAAEHDEDARLGARMLCLDRRLRKLDVLLTVLEEGDASVVSNATEAVDALPAVGMCGAVESLAELEDNPDPEVEALRDQIAYAEALRESASLEQADRAARDVLAAVVPRQDKWLETEARLVVGWVEHDLGRHEASEEQLRIALALGTVSRNDRAVSIALHRLAWVVGYKLGRHQEGRDLADRAAAWAERLEGPDTQASSRALSRGWIEHDAGDPDAALEFFGVAEALARRGSPSNLEATYDLGLALNGTGGAQLGRGDLDAAAAAFDQAATLLAARLGPSHPRVGQVLNNRAGILRALGRPVEALAVFERTYRMFVDVYGVEHMAVGQTAANMAIVLGDLARYDDAVVRADEAVRVLSKVAGETHSLVAKSYALRGDAQIGLQNYEEGTRDLLRALSIETEVLGSDHPSLGISLTNLSIAYDKMGRLEDAVERQEQALEILLGAHGDSHTLVATARMNLAYLERSRRDYPRSLALYRKALEHVGDVSRGLALLGAGESHLLVGEVEPAATLFEEAASFLEDKPPGLGSRGEALYLLAQARWMQGRRAEARTLATESVEVLGEEDDDELRREVRIWLQSPGPYKPDEE
ncbi:MAG: tetratricopeptide repeat protein [Nannocystales bacterium]